MNQINLIGFMAYEPKIQMSKSQNPYVRFILSVPIIGKKKEYDFFSCIVYGKSAEALASYVKKGNKLALTGYVKTGKNEKNGETMHTFSVQVRSFYTMSYNSESETGEETPENLEFLYE